MAIDFFASSIHYIDHLVPIYNQLSDEYKGNFYTRENLIETLDNLNIDAKPLQEKNDLEITLTSSFGDLRDARKTGAPIIISEHGAGQSYKDNYSPAYIGGIDRRGAIAALVPGIKQAEKQLKAYPTIPVYPIGIPKLDNYHKNLDLYNSKVKKDSVVISFHWDCKVEQETRSCYRFYKSIIKEMKKDFNIKIHGHPRDIKKYKAFADYIKVDHLETFDQVIEEGWIYCCDNSSTIFEWISLNRPVVLLNCHLYRKNIEHGMRFWEYADIGPNVDVPKTFPNVLQKALTNHTQYQQRREEVKNEVYFQPDGQGAKRACLALEDIHNNYHDSATNNKIYTFNL